MAGVIDGQPVNQSITNSAFIFKNGDDDINFKIGLISIISGYGSAIQNIQREFNAHASFLGVSLNQVYNITPSWPSNNFGSSSDNIFQRICSIDSGVRLFKRGSVNIPNGSSSFFVTFPTLWTSDNYVAIGSIKCQDSNPIFLNFLITSQDSSGFSVVLNAQADSSNYFFNYSIGDEV